MIPVVVANEPGGAQTTPLSKPAGVGGVGLDTVQTVRQHRDRVSNLPGSRTHLEGATRGVRVP